MGRTMKPLILYSMPRTRSTAMLQACKHPQKLHEPFDNLTLFPEGRFDIWQLGKNWQRVVPPSRWDAIKFQMNQPGTVSKFFGHSLYYLDSANDWFQEVQDQGTHEIFVIVRDFKEVAWSYFLAFYFGWDSRMQYTPDSVTVHTKCIEMFDFIVQCFIEFLPRNARLISWEHLPGEYFDKSTVQISDQKTNTKLDLVANRDWCEEHIERLQQKYHPVLQDRVYNMPWA